MWSTPAPILLVTQRWTYWLPYCDFHGRFNGFEYCIQNLRKRWEFLDSSEWRYDGKGARRLRRAREASINFVFSSHLFILNSIDNSVKHCPRDNDRSSASKSCLVSGKTSLGNFLSFHICEEIPYQPRSSPPPTPQNVDLGMAESVTLREYLYFTRAICLYSRVHALSVTSRCFRNAVTVHMDLNNACS